MNELDKVLHALMKANVKVIAKNASQEQQNDLAEALIKNKKEQIIAEIKAEYRKEVIKEAHIEIQRKVFKQKLTDLKELMMSGFVLAFIVGLAVNQMTDIISYCKGASSIQDIKTTIIITAILFVLCLGFYAYNFVKTAIEVIEQNKD